MNHTVPIHEHKNGSQWDKKWHRELLSLFSITVILIINVYNYHVVYRHPHTRRRQHIVRTDAYTQLNRLNNCTLTRYWKLLKERLVVWCLSIDPFSNYGLKATKFYQWFDSFPISISKIISERCGSSRHPTLEQNHIPRETSVEQLLRQLLALLNGGRVYDMLLVVLQQLPIVSGPVLRHEFRGFTGLWLQQT